VAVEKASMMATDPPRISMPMTGMVLPAWNNGKLHM